MPLFRYSITLKSSFNENTRFVQNRVMPDQTLKKKKSIELEFQNATIGVSNAAIGVPECCYS